MKRIAKTIALILAMLLLGLTLGACVGSSPSSVVGRWSDNDDDTAVLEFKSNGTYTYAWSDEGYELSWSGTYTVTGNTIQVNYEDWEMESSDTFFIAGRLLTIQGGIVGGTYTKMD